MSELTDMPEWKQIVREIEESLDKAKDQVVASTVREDLSRVRFLAGQYAGIRSVYNFLVQRSR